MIIHSPEPVSTTISALSDEGVLYSQVRQGINTDMEFLHFLIELEKKLHRKYIDTYKVYKSKLVVVFDNASIHLTDSIYTFFRKKAIVAITLPQYSPWMNPIEKVFRAVKLKMSRSNEPEK
ncbi:MAG: transposase [Streptococcus sp.]|nr:transposase [Streptococcus sp.]